MSQKYSKLVRQTFELAKQFGRFLYPGHNIDWDRVELVEHHSYEVSPSALGRKLLDHDEALGHLVRLTQETIGPIYVRLDQHLNPTVHDIHPDEGSLAGE